MRLFKRKRSTPKAAPTPPADQPKKRQTNVPLEIKLLALEALQHGLIRKEVAEIVGVSPVTLGGWFLLGDLYRASGERDSAMVAFEKVLESSTGTALADSARARLVAAGDR